MKQNNKNISVLRYIKVNYLIILIMFSVVLNILLIVRIIQHDQDNIHDTKINVQVLLKGEQLITQANQAVYDSNNKKVDVTKKVDNKHYYKLKVGVYEIVKFDIDNGIAEIIQLYVKK